MMLLAPSLPVQVDLNPASLDHCFQKLEGFKNANSSSVRGPGSGEHLSLTFRIPSTRKAVMQLVRKLVEFHPYGPALKGSGDERAKATKLLNEIQDLGG